MSAAKHTPGRFVDGRAVDSFGRPLPSEAVSIDVVQPPVHQLVILYIEDAGVAIHGKPVVGWNSRSLGDPHWWTGVPGDYINLATRKWVVTHWAPLPGDEESRAAIAKSTGGAA